MRVLDNNYVWKANHYKQYGALRSLFRVIVGKSVSSLEQITTSTKNVLNLVMSQMNSDWIQTLEAHFLSQRRVNIPDWGSFGAGRV